MEVGVYGYEGFPGSWFNLDVEYSTVSGAVAYQEWTYLKDVQNGSTYPVLSVDGGSYVAAYPGAVQGTFDVYGVAGVPGPPANQVSADVQVTYSRGVSDPDYVGTALFTQIGHQFALGFNAAAARADFRTHVDPMLEWPDGTADIQFEGLGTFLGAELAGGYTVNGTTGTRRVGATVQLRASGFTAAALGTPQPYARSGTVLWQVDLATLTINDAVTKPITAFDVTSVADSVTGEFTVTSAAVVDSVTVPAWLDTQNRYATFALTSLGVTYLCDAPRARYLYEEEPVVLVEGGWRRDGRMFT